jgi:myo-inositol 2-dehydrogenase/D-chiro-inositol 1-dehydrogenase/scyllo-inositol 2-dehydrogenase (NAD+)
MDINIAVIGAGRMGTLHSRNFAKRVSRSRVTSILDSDRALAEKLASELNAAAFTDIDTMLSSADIDAVCISTPIATHKEFSLKALKAKKHVLCEKPLTLTVEDAQEIIAARDNSGCFFQLAFMRRFDDSFIAAKQKLDQGLIGEPVFIRSSGRDPGLPPVPGWGSDPDACGDISFELCSHDYDSMQWLLGSNIKKVYAQAGILSSKDVAAKLDKMINDTIVINAEFESGTLGSIDGLLNIKYGYDARVEIVGDEGIIFIGDPRHMDVTWGGREKVLTFPTCPAFSDRFSQAYVKQAQHFIDCIIENKTPIVGAEDGLSAVKVALAVNESIKSGNSVIIE